MELADRKKCSIGILPSQKKLKKCNFRLAHGFMTDDFIAQERKNTAEIYLPNTDTWVLEIGGDVKGFIALMGNEVGALFLQPEYHGMGAASIATEIHC